MRKAELRHCLSPLRENPCYSTPALRLATATPNVFTRPRRQPVTVGFFHPVPMVVEVSHRNHFGKRSESSLMVLVPVADHDVVDLFETGCLRGRVNTFGVAVANLKAGVE